MIKQFIYYGIKMKEKLTENIDRVKELMGVLSEQQLGASRSGRIKDVKSVDQGDGFVPKGSPSYKYDLQPINRTKMGPKGELYVNEPGGTLNVAQFIEKYWGPKSSWVNLPKTHFHHPDVKWDGSRKNGPGITHDGKGKAIQYTSAHNGVEWVGAKLRDGTLTGTDWIKENTGGTGKGGGSGTLEDPFTVLVAPSAAKKGSYYINPKNNKIYRFDGTRYGDPIESKTTKSGGKVEKKPPFIRIKDLGDNVLEIIAKGEFPVNVTESGLSDKFIEALIETISQDENGARMLETGDMNITIADVKSSASNFFNGPVKPTKSNTQKEPVIDKPDSYYTGNETKNNRLALKRGQNLFAELEKKLPAKRINITAKPKFTQVITDTGGEYDENRDVKKYRRAGQFVTIKATVELIPLAIITQVKCLQGMKVTVGYYANINNIKKKLEKAQGNYKTALQAAVTYSQNINKGRTSSSGHNCNRAVFWVWLNNNRIGKINLNNAGTGDDAGKDLVPGTNGGSREVMLTVKDAVAARIAKAGEEGKGTVTFYLEPVSKDAHNDVPWIKIETEKGKVLLDAEASTISTYNSNRGANKGKKMKVFGPFDPCEVIT